MIGDYHEPEIPIYQASPKICPIFGQKHLHPVLLSLRSISSRLPKMNFSEGWTENVHLNHSKDQCWLVLIGDLSYLFFWGMIIHSTTGYFHVSSMMGWGYLFIPGVTRPGMKPKCCDASVDASWCVSCFQWCLTCLPERSQLKIPCFRKSAMRWGVAR